MTVRQGDLRSKLAHTMFLMPQMCWQQKLN